MNTVQELREITGRGIVECKSALAACDNDLKLAQAYLAFNNLSVRILPTGDETEREARHRWVMERARETANDF